MCAPIAGIRLRRTHAFATIAVHLCTEQVLSMHLPDTVAAPVSPVFTAAAYAVQSQPAVRKNKDHTRVRRILQIILESFSLLAAAAAFIFVFLVGTAVKGSLENVEDSMISMASNDIYYYFGQAYKDIETALSQVEQYPGYLPTSLYVSTVFGTVNSCCHADRDRHSVCFHACEIHPRHPGKNAKKCARSCSNDVFLIPCRGTAFPCRTECLPDDLCDTDRYDDIGFCSARSERSHYCRHLHRCSRTVRLCRLFRYRKYSARRLQQKSLPPPVRTCGNCSRRRRPRLCHERIGTVFNYARSFRAVGTFDHNRLRIYPSADRTLYRRFQQRHRAFGI